jgi:hypothetical protein
LCPFTLNIKTTTERRRNENKSKKKCENKKEERIEGNRMYGKRENFTYFPPSHAKTCCAWRCNIKLHKFQLGSLYTVL